MLPSTLNIKWLMHQQSLILLYTRFKEKMHLQENTLFDLDLGGQGHKKCCPEPSTPCDLCTYRVLSYYVKRFRRRSIYKKIQYLTFDLDLGVKVTQNVAQYPLHHVTYSATKFEVATSNRNGGDIYLQENTIIDLWPWPWGQGHTKCCPVPSTSCDLLSYKVWSC